MKLCVNMSAGRPKSRSNTRMPACEIPLKVLSTTSPSTGHRTSPDAQPLRGQVPVIGGPGETSSAERGVHRGFRCRRQPRGPRRKSLLKPRAKRGILSPTPIPAVPFPESSSRVIRLENPEGQLEEVTLPPTLEDLRRQAMIEQTPAFL